MNDIELKVFLKERTKISREREEKYNKKNYKYGKLYHDKIIDLLQANTMCQSYRIAKEFCSEIYINEYGYSVNNSFWYISEKFYLKCLAKGIIY